MARRVDEQPHLQVWTRTRLVQPMRQVVRELGYQHRQHGTTALLAAPDIGAARVIGTCKRRHRAVEFSKIIDALGFFELSDHSTT